LIARKGLSTTVEDPTELTYW